MQSHHSRLVCIAIGLVALMVFVAVRAPFLSLPLERDEGEYAYIAQRIAAGEVPYRDAFDQKPPGTFVAYRLAFAMFGESIIAIHLFASLWSALTVVWLFALMARLAGPLAAAFAALILSIAAADPRIAGTAANTEAFMIGPLVGSVYCLVRAIEHDRWHWWVATGFLTVVAVWFKQVAGVNALLIGATAIATVWRTPPLQAMSALARIGGWVGLGGAMAAAPVLIYFVTAGAWAPFVDAVFIHNLAYAGSLSLRSGMQVLWLRFNEQLPSQGLFWLVALAALLAPRVTAVRYRPLLAGFVLTSALGVSVGLYFRPHYFVQWTPAVAGLAGVGFAAVSRWMSERSSLAGGLGVAGLIVLIVVPPVWANRVTLFAESHADISRDIYGINPFPESIRIAEYIRHTSQPDDTIHIIGSEPQILFYAQRRSATRYIFFYPLTGGFADSLQRQREVLAEVRERKPLYVVWVNIVTSLLVNESTDRLVFLESAKWLRENYALEFLARPSAKQADFDFAFGGRGRRTLAFLDGKMEDNPWVAVFRRNP